MNPLRDYRIAFYILIFVTPSRSESNILKEYKNCEDDATNCIGVKVKTDLNEKECTINCKYVATLALEASATKLSVSLYSRSSYGYVALGISLDEKMGDDLVVVCVVYPNESYMISYLSWNRGRGNYRLIDQSALNFTHGIVENDGMLCQFLIPTILNMNDIKFDLGSNEKTETSYHFLLAGGPARTDFIKYHDARIAAEKLNQIRVHPNETQPNYSAEEIHAGYMIFTWIVWIPVGTFVSRFYKETWSTVYLWNKRLWFMIHTFCMVFAIVMSLTAYILVMYDRNQWIPPSTPSSIHGTIGIVAVSLLVIQCTAGWFRPANPIARKLCAKIHCFTGMSCYLTGIINVLLAPILTHNILPCSATNLTIAWIALHFTFYFIMTAYIFWTDWHLGIGGWRAATAFPMPIATSEEAVRPNLRKAILGLFIFTSCVFAFVLIASMAHPACLPKHNLECSMT